MKEADIEQIRQTLKKALGFVAGERINYDTFPVKDHLEKMLEQKYRVCEIDIEKALALLLCETCKEETIEEIRALLEEVKYQCEEAIDHKQLGRIPEALKANAKALALLLKYDPEIIKNPRNF